MFTLALAASLAAALCAEAQQAPASPPQTQLPPVQVQGNYSAGIGTSDAASQGTVTSKLIESRPTLRPAEVLEFVPGVIVTQHSGDGKANQYFLRGFNLDHGTDFATFVDGMPVNMPTHAHGHGYSDLNWLIPELVNRISYKKGPYFADEGDFASAGAARIALFGELPKGIASMTLSENRYARGLLANSTPMTTGTLLYAVEAAHNDGPWQQPEKFHRLNGVLRYSLGEGDSRSSLTAMAYSAGWNVTDQIPQRAVDSGLVDRFGAIHTTDGGRTARYSLSFNTERSYDDGSFKFNAYAIRSRLDLFSNFTFNLDKPEPPLNADQFEQAEQRRVFGLAASRRFNGKLAGVESTNTIGVQLRHDRIPLGPVQRTGRPAHRHYAGSNGARNQRRLVRRKRNAMDALASQRGRPSIRPLSLPCGEFRRCQQRQRQRRHHQPQARPDLRAVEQDRGLRQPRLGLSQQRRARRHRSHLAGRRAGALQGQ